MMRLLTLLALFSVSLGVEATTVAVCDSGIAVFAIAGQSSYWEAGCNGFNASWSTLDLAPFITNAGSIPDLANALNANTTDIANLQTAVSALTTTVNAHTSSISTAQTAITDLQSRVAKLEAAAAPFSIS